MSEGTKRAKVRRAVDPDDEPLAVAVIGGRLVISIGVTTLTHAVTIGAGREEVISVTDPLAAAREIAAELCREDEDGTTLVHKLLDEAAWEAWENGGDGFADIIPAADEPTP